MKYRPKRLLLLFGFCFAGCWIFAATPTPAGDEATALDLTSRLGQMIYNSANPDIKKLADLIPAITEAIKAEQLNEAVQLANGFALAVPEDEPRFIELTVQLNESLQVVAARLSNAHDQAFAALSAVFLEKFQQRAPAQAFDELLKQTGEAPLSDVYGREKLRIDLLRRSIALWQDYIIHSQAEDWERARQAMAELLNNSIQFPLIPRSELVLLQLALNSPEDTTSVAKSGLIFEFQKRLGALIENRKSPRDFDAIILELGRLTKGVSSNAQAENLRHAAMRWQEYFADVEAGKRGDAANLLNMISSDQGITAFFPRSKILEMINKDRNQPELTKPLVSPEELKFENLNLFREQLEFRRDFGPAVDFNLETILTAASSLCGGWKYLNEKHPEAVIDSYFTNNSPINEKNLGKYTEVINRLQRELVERAVSDFLQAPVDLPHNLHETNANYCDRLIAHHLERKDWPAVYRVLTAARSLRINNSHSNSDLNAFGQFLDGLQQERAELWPSAVLSYYRALSARSMIIPAEEIGLRLKGIKTAHPDEYKNVTFQTTYRD